jgi:hypothetical protein
LGSQTKVFQEYLPYKRFGDISLISKSTGLPTNTVWRIVQQKTLNPGVNAALKVTSELEKLIAERKQEAANVEK